MKKIRYQKFTKAIPKNETTDFSFETDKQYLKASEISIYTDTDFATNVNHTLGKDMTIGRVNVLDAGFDTALLFPRLGNKEFRKIDVEANGKTFEGSIVNATGTDYTITFILKLENE